MYEKNGDKEIYFWYNESGHLAAVRIFTPETSLTGYVMTNSQGDVLRIYGGAGELYATYEYDAWGKLVSITDNTEIGIGINNPIRYRGYYYDTETGLYYLQSRYYDPEVGRFINADTPIMVLANGDNIIGMNMFCYCNNNPKNRTDPSGYYSISSWIISSAIDLMLILMNPAIQGSFTLIVKSFKGFLKWSWSQQLAIKLIKGAVPAIKGLMKAGLTLVRTVIWRTTGVTLYFLQNYMIDKLFSKYKIWNYISIFSSYGSFFAFFLDVMSDNKFDSKIKLW